MDRDSRRMRGDRPFLFTCLKNKNGVDEVADFVLKMTGLDTDHPALEVQD